MVSRMLSHLRGTRQFTSPYAPDFFILGAQVKHDAVEHLEAPIYVMGKGTSHSIAQARLCGEAVERMSVFAKGANANWHASNPLTGLTKEISPTGFFPRKSRPATHGCASHNHAGTAALLALAELWERRAVQDWWEGSSRLRRLEESHPIFVELKPFVSGLRSNAFEGRETQFYQIAGDFPINVAMAVSFDKDYYQIAVAFAADINPVLVFRRAFEELLSVELETADLFGSRLKGDEIAEGTNQHRVYLRQLMMKERLTEEFKTCSAIERSMPMQAEKLSINNFLALSKVVGRQIWLIDMTHPAAGIPTVRAIFDRPEDYPFVNYSDEEITPL